MQKHRYSETTDHPEVALYKVCGGKEYDIKVAPLIQKCRDITARIQSGSLDTGKGWVRTQPVSVADRLEFISQKKALKDMTEAGGRGGKNILTATVPSDTMIGHGKDSNVYALRGEKQKFIYKESAQKDSIQESSPENVLYLRRKYNILKKYLGDIIPQSRFIFGEVNHPTRIVKGVDLVDIPQKSVITIQRRIQGQDLQKIPKEEKNNPSLLRALKQAHQKYILLKMFIAVIAREMGLPEDTLDVKMDLGPLSDMDRFDIQDPLNIRKNLISPNIMWDGKNIYFVDMDIGKWNDDKEKLYSYLMMPDTIQRWDETMGNMGLINME